MRSYRERGTRIRCLALALLTKPMLLILLLFVLSVSVYEKRYASIPLTCVLPLVLVIIIYRLFNLSFNDFSAFGGPRHRGLVYIFTAALFCYHWGWFFVRSGWKSASTPSSDGYNEIMFEDKKGGELLKIHAERNQSISVEADETHTVGHDRSKSIGKGGFQSLIRVVHLNGMPFSLRS